jgi:dipeptidyl aminopeptidase/acylaminoacyl peptidase
MSQTSLRCTIILFLLLLCLPLSGLAQARQPLDHNAYEIWNRIDEQAISNDGRWAAWSMSPEERDGMLVLRYLNGERRFEAERGSNAQFSHDSRHAAFVLKPKREAIRQARLDELPEEKQPKSGLAILNLDSGEQHDVGRVRSYRFPEKAGGWIAYHLEAPLKDKDDDNGRDESDNDSEDARDDEQKPGTELVLRNLDSGEEQRFEHVSDYAFSPGGGMLVYTAVTPDGRGDGIFAVDTETGAARPILSGKGAYPALAIDEAGTQVAFLARLHEGEESERPEHAFTLYHWRPGDRRPVVLADENARIFSGGWHVSKHRAPVFSANGQRVFFGSAPAPIERPDHDDRLDDEVVKVEVWHWQDDFLQPMQQVRLDEERKRSYLAVAHLDNRRLVQLGRESIPETDKGARGDARFVLGISDLPHRKRISWDFPRYFDAYLIDVNSGRATRVLEGVQSRPHLSPAAGYLGWWDRDEQTWYAMDVRRPVKIDLGKDVPHALHDHTNDRPFAANAYGTAGWTRDDAAFIFYDRHDVWVVDPMGDAPARKLSEGIGRERNLNLRLVDLDPDEDGIDPELPVLLSAFDEDSKSAGFLAASLDGDRPVRELLMSAHRYGTPTLARKAERLLLTRENFHEFPDLWVSNADFTDIQRISDANPQQKDYLWGTVELVEWKSATDEELQGLLFKPEDFDEGKSYPMIVYFYERDSDGLHRHRPPQAHRSVIIPTFYTSRGYVVFVPDIKYREGHPGESAMEAIMPKTLALAEQPWIDADRVGIQGHSWAGYQIAYMVTRTDFFRAAAGGAPVSNMVSAYGGIRWQTGMSRMFQYERTQSRLGATLWEAPELYLENSPIFMADRINTPLLMMHNDEDGAVPWEQGIELFTALRRLGQPAWLINYSGEPHWPTTYANRRDWQLRLQQYLDHYLKDAPAPRWLASGIPALEQGATLGLEPVD